MSSDSTQCPANNGLVLVLVEEIQSGELTDPGYHDGMHPKEDKRERSFKEALLFLEWIRGMEWRVQSLLAQMKEWDINFKPTREGQRCFRLSFLFLLRYFLSF